MSEENLSISKNLRDIYIENFIDELLTHKYNNKFSLSDCQLFRDELLVKKEIFNQIDEIAILDALLKENELNLKRLENIPDNYCEDCGRECDGVHSN
jgi:hypothetical protein